MDKHQFLKLMILCYTSRHEARIPILRGSIPKLTQRPIDKKWMELEDSYGIGGRSAGMEGSRNSTGRLKLSTNIDPWSSQRLNYTQKNTQRQDIGYPCICSFNAAWFHIGPHIYLSGLCQKQLPLCVIYSSSCSSLWDHSRGGST